jgi:hypothetical protein
MQDKSFLSNVHYHAMNAITVQNNAPLPPASKTLGGLHGTKVSKRLDLRGAYNLAPRRRMEDGVQNQMAPVRVHRHAV